MASPFKPDGYTSASPYLIVDGAAETIAFLERAFGATELRRFPDDAGRLLHAEVRIDDTVVMVADSAEGWPPVPSHVHLYVPDVDVGYRAALDAGAASVQEPAQREGDEDRRGGVRDARGTTWWIATRVG
jgi:PhnB protein